MSKFKVGNFVKCVGITDEEDDNGWLIIGKVYEVVDPKSIFSEKRLDELGLEDDGSTFVFDDNDIVNMHWGKFVLVDHTTTLVIQKVIDEEIRKMKGN